MRNLQKTERDANVRMGREDGSIDELASNGGTVSPVSEITIVSPETQLMEKMVKLLQAGQCPTTLAFPKLNLYSGAEPPGKGEVSFEQWRYEVQALEVSHEASVVREAIIRSLCEPAATVMRGIPPGTSIAHIIKRMEQHCDPTVDVQCMIHDFNNLKQGSRESAAAFITKLEGTMHKIQSKYPREYTEHRAAEVLRRAFYQGLKGSLRDSLRFLYEDSSKTYKELVSKAIQIDGERSEKSVTSNAATVAEDAVSTNQIGSSISTEIQELFKLLTAAIQTNSTSKPKPAKQNTCVRAAQVQTNQTGQQVGQQNQQANRAGRGRQDRAMAVCDNCKGIGHYWCQCASELREDLNARRGARQATPQNQGRPGNNPNAPTFVPRQQPSQNQAAGANRVQGQQN